MVRLFLQVVVAQNSMSFGELFCLIVDIWTQLPVNLGEMVIYSIYINWLKPRWIYMYAKTMLRDRMFQRDRKFYLLFSLFLISCALVLWSLPLILTDAETLHIFCYFWTFSLVSCVGCHFWFFLVPHLRNWMEVFLCPT